MYRFGSRIRYSETDEYGALSLIGIMNYLQDCSTFQSEDLGLGIACLANHNRAWWLSSWQILIDRYPQLGEEVLISTWSYGFKGIYGYRNFTIQDQQGNYLVRADSTWFFFDTAAGSPVRASTEDIRGYEEGEERLPMPNLPRHIPIPQDYREGAPIVIGKHHLDSNHHVNNAQYVEIAKESLPDDFVIRTIWVEYKKAARLGDVVIPHISRHEEGCTIVLCNPENIPYAVMRLQP
ncbi:MAG: thioesterase [Hungatella sp.]